MFRLGSTWLLSLPYCSKLSLSSTTIIETSKIIQGFPCLLLGVSSVFLWIPAATSIFQHIPKYSNSFQDVPRPFRVILRHFRVLQAFPRCSRIFQDHQIASSGLWAHGYLPCPSCVMHATACILEVSTRLRVFYLLCLCQALEGSGHVFVHAKPMPSYDTHVPSWANTCANFCLGPSRGFPT